jgi:parallel beta-helix repeat protein
LKIRFKKFKLICLVVFFLFTNGSNIIFSTNAFGDSSDVTKYDELLQFTYQFDYPKITNFNISDNTFSSIAITNLSTNTIQGQPTLPVKTVSILLPPFTEFEDISIITRSKEIIPLNHSILLNEIHSNQKIMAQNTNDTSHLLPPNNIDILGIGMARGYRILLLNIYPCIYNPENNNLLFSEHISFSVNIIEKNHDYTLFRDLAEDEAHISNIVENPLLSYYYSEKIAVDNKDSAEEKFKYIIITNDELEPHFSSLIRYKEQYLSSRTVNFSFIHDNFFGKDMSEKIRECIIHAYINWDTEYVLLGGDVDIVPYRGLWGRAVDHTGTLLHDTSIPADIYYAGLDSSWDLDNDNIYGENSEHSISDEADFFAEVFVGRAPVKNKVEIGTFINKVITYETSEKPQKVLLHQSGINRNNDPDSTIIAENCAQWVPNSYEITRLYQKNETITSSIWMDHFSNDNLIVQHTGNGELDQYFVSWPTQVFTSYQSLSMLKNNFYPIHTSVACYSGGFDHEDSIAETMLLNPYGGASACLFNSRRGFTSSIDAHRYSGEFIEEQFRNIFFNDVEHLGKVYQYGKEAFAAYAMVDPAYRWVYYTLNLLGDPEMPVLGQRQKYLNANRYYVDDDFSDQTIGWNITHFASIQDGIDAASDWDIVHVNSGTYNEIITIRKTIQLIGEDKKTTIIDGKNGRGPIRITANRVIIKGFTIKNDALSPYASRIHITNSNYITISDCIISDNSIGIYSTETTNLFIVDNKFSQNQISVFFPMKIGTVYISNNDFFIEGQNSYGVYADASAEYIIHDNSFSSKSSFPQFDCALYLTGKTEIYNNDIRNFNIGIWLKNGEGIVEKNVISGNDHIGLYATEYSLEINDNTIENNGNNWITYLHDIEPGGIVLEGGNQDSCVIQHNIIKGNRGYGIILNNYFGMNNKIVKNDFMSNSINAFYRNSFCGWNNNYWDIGRIFPKIIFGVYETNTFLKVPTISIDFFPRSLKLT